MGEGDELFRPGCRPNMDDFDQVMDYVQKLEEKAQKAEEALAKEAQLRKELEEKNAKTLQEKSELAQQLESEKGALGDVQERIAKISGQKADLESQLAVSENSTFSLLPQFFPLHNWIRVGGWSFRVCEWLIKSVFAWRHGRV